MSINYKTTMTIWYPVRSGIIHAHCHMHTHTNCINSQGCVWRWRGRRGRKGRRREVVSMQGDGTCLMAVQSLVPCISTALCSASSSVASHRFHTRFLPRDDAALAAPPLPTPPLEATGITAFLFAKPVLPVLLGNR